MGKEELQKAARFSNFVELHNGFEMYKINEYSLYIH